MTIKELIRLAEQLDVKLYGDVDNELIIKHIKEEVDELLATSNSELLADKFNQIEELGDIFFCLIAYAKQNKIDIIHALSLTICKLRDRIKKKRN